MTEMYGERGFNVKCVLCEPDDAGESTVSVDLDDLSNFRCDTCGECFSVDDVQKTIDAAKQWESVLAWLKTAPKLPEAK